MGEAIARHHRFVVEVIEAGNFCPWAQNARKKGRTQIHAAYLRVLPDALLDSLKAADDQTEVIQWVVPDGPANAMQWRDILAQLEKELRRRTPDLPWAFAAFHPTHPGRPESIGGAIGLLRRSPCPAIQCVRLASLDAVRLPDDGAAADAVSLRNQRVLTEKWSDYWEHVLLATHAGNVPHA